MRTLVVLGSGGHTTEILALCGAMEASRYVPATFVVAATDHMSEKRAVDTLLSTRWAESRDDCRFWRVPVRNRPRSTVSVRILAYTDLNRAEIDDSAPARSASPG